MDIIADRVKQIPPYVFADFQRKKQEMVAKGADVIDLGIGAPDLPAPSSMIEKLSEEAKKTANHRYSSFQGCKEFREAVAAFYKKQYDAEIDPETEVLTLIGSKEGLVQLMQTVINPGEGVLVPNPGYPAYRTAVRLVNGVVYDLPLDASCNYRPKLDELSEQAKQAKLLLLNYPSNPTAATVSVDVFEAAIAFGRKNNTFIAHDSAYNLIQFGNYKAPSILQVDGAKELAVEFGTLSKNFNMAGWRIGYVVGNKKVIQALAALKSNMDTSQFLPIQKAAAKALNSDLSNPRENSRIYEERMHVLYDALHRLGLEAEKPRGTIFLWVKVPGHYTSSAFADLLLEQAHIIVTPGHFFGSAGEGFIRIALTVPLDRIQTVIARLENVKGMENV